MTETPGEAVVEAGKEAHHTAQEVTSKPVQETEKVTTTVTETVETDDPKQ